MSNYVTMEDFRRTAQLGDLPIDEQAQIALDAAEEAIEDYCGRRFYLDEEPTTRFYRGVSNGREVWVDDLVSVSTLEGDDDGDGTYETTWTSGDYRLAPYNASADGRPYTRIETSPLGTKRFYSHAAAVRLTGIFGWTAVPDRVKQATSLQALRWLKRVRSAPLGVEAIVIEGAPVRVRNRVDPDVEVLLAPLRRSAP
ncbi:MAG TPA: hypothetical protein VFT76_01955 [Actinomycetota bacterium]|nr:hypothetical protein [Actinomycetota bacterium]